MLKFDNVWGYTFLLIILLVLIGTGLLLPLAIVASVVAVLYLIFKSFGDKAE